MANSTVKSCSLSTFLTWFSKELMKNCQIKYKENIKFWDIIRLMLIDGQGQGRVVKGTSQR